MEDMAPAPAVSLPVGANYKNGTKKSKKDATMTGSSTGRAGSLSPSTNNNNNNNIISKINIISPKEPKQNQIMPPEKYHNWKRHLYNGCDEVRGDQS